MKKNKKPQGRCIFCNGFNLSKQHIFPDWINRLITQVNEHSQTVIIADTSEQLVKKDYTIYVSPELRKKQGPLGSAKLRIVCKKCNNGWMSDLEQSVIPFLLPLIKGEKSEITQIESGLLAQWIMMTTIMHEYTDLNGISTTYEERQALVNGIIPPSWDIYIANSGESEWKFRRKQTYSKFIVPAELLETKEEKYYMHSLTSFGIGEVFISAYSSQYNKIKLHLQEGFPNLTCIYQQNKPLAGHLKKLTPGQPELITASIVDSHYIKVSDQPLY